MYEKIVIFGIFRGGGRNFFAFFAGTFKIALAILVGVCYTVSVKVAGREFVPPDDPPSVKNGARPSGFPTFTRYALPYGRAGAGTRDAAADGSFLIYNVPIAGR